MFKLAVFSGLFVLSACSPERHVEVTCKDTNVPRISRSARTSEAGTMVTLMDGTIIELSPAVQCLIIRHATSN